MVVMDLRGNIILYPRPKGKGNCEKIFKLFHKVHSLCGKLPHPAAVRSPPPDGAANFREIPAYSPVMSWIFLALSSKSSIQSPVTSVYVTV